jgi:hypothetical protein
VDDQDYDDDDDYDSYYDDDIYDDWYRWRCYWNIKMSKNLWDQRDEMMMIVTIVMII